MCYQYFDSGNFIHFELHFEQMHIFIFMGCRDFLRASGIHERHRNSQGSAALASGGPVHVLLARPW